MNIGYKYILIKKLLNPEKLLKLYCTELATYEKENRDMQKMDEEENTVPILSN